MAILRTIMNELHRLANGESFPVAFGYAIPSNGDIGCETSTGWYFRFHIQDRVIMRIEQAKAPGGDSFLHDHLERLCQQHGEQYHSPEDFFVPSDFFRFMERIMFHAQFEMDLLRHTYHPQPSLSSEYDESMITITRREDIDPPGFLATFPTIHGTFLGELGETEAEAKGELLGAIAGEWFWRRIQTGWLPHESDKLEVCYYCNRQTLIVSANDGVTCLHCGYHGKYLEQHGFPPSTRTCPRCESLDLFISETGFGCYHCETIGIFLRSES